MREREYRRLLDKDPDAAFKWMCGNRFVYYPMGDNVYIFEPDLLEQFMTKLLDALGLSPARAREMLRLRDGDLEDAAGALDMDEEQFAAVEEAFDSLCVRLPGDDGETTVGDTGLVMDWECADPRAVLNWLGDLGFPVRFYGESNPLEGEVGAWFIK